MEMKNKELAVSQSKFLDLMQKEIQKDKVQFGTHTIEPFVCIELYPDLLVS